jgi:hypothetical protein
LKYNVSLQTPQMFTPAGVDPAVALQAPHMNRQAGIREGTLPCVYPTALHLVLLLPPLLLLLLLPSQGSTV